MNLKRYPLPLSSDLSSEGVATLLACALGIPQGTPGESYPQGTPRDHYPWGF